MGKSSPSRARAILMNTLGVLVIAFGIASIPVGFYYTSHGSRWGAPLGAVAFILGMFVARLFFVAGYRDKPSIDERQ